VQRTTERTGRAIVHTSVVLIVGFGVLGTSAFPPNQLFAVLASVVIASALMADLWLLPALLLVLRPSVPGAPRAGTVRP
jgi:predicted RND superfamily exporter protein